MDISNLSIDELKIRAYDESVALANAENIVTTLKNNLKVISQQISNKLNAKKMDEETPAVDETATEETPSTEETSTEETPADEVPASDESAESTEDTETATE